MSERRLIKMDGAKAQKNSGRGQYQKGDATLPPFLIDYKEYAKSFSVSIDNWKKLSEDAWECGHLEPAFCLVLGGETKVAVIDWQLFKDMREAYLNVSE